MKFSLQLVFMSCAIGLAAPSAFAADVFIYYANETYLDAPMQENYRIISKWLTEPPIDSKAQVIASQIQKDTIDFPAHVAEEIAEIKNSLKGRTDVRAVFFTNALAFQNQFEISDDHNERFLVQSWQPHSAERPLLNSMRLLNPANLALALKTVADRFPPNDYRYVLVTKSHGNAKYALVSRLAVWHSDSSKDEVRRVIHTPVNAPPESFPSWVDRTGISKAEYFRILGDAKDSLHLRFYAVFVEACNSQEGLRQGFQLPNNIDILAAPNLKLQYRSLDYAHLSAKSGAAAKDSFAEAFVREMEQKFPRDIARKVRPSLWQRLIGNWYYFAPLVILFLPKFRKIVLSRHRELR